MRRIIAAAWVAVLTTAGPAATAEPVPVWSADLSDKQKPRTFVDWLGYAPDGKTLVARTLSPNPASKDRLRPGEVTQLCVLDVPGRRERFRLDPEVVGPWSRSPPLGPPCGFPSADVLLTAGGRLVSTADGKPLGGRRPIPGDVAQAAVWVSAGGKGYTLLRAGEDIKTTVVRGALPPPPRPGDKAGEAWKESAPQVVADESRVVTAAAVSPDGTRVAVAGGRPDQITRERVLTLYQITAGETAELVTLARVEAPHQGAVCALRFSPDGRVLASGGAEGELKLWDEPKPGGEWKPRATVGGPDFTVGAISFRPDGRVLAFGTMDKKKPNVWPVDVATGKVLRSFRVSGERAQVMAVAFSPDGQSLATGSSLGRLEVWDAAKLLEGQ